MLFRSWTYNARLALRDVDMKYRIVRLSERVDLAPDFKVFRTSEHIKAEPGQFVFAWIPGVGEKPFSVMDDEPLTLGVLGRGEFTNKFNSLNRGDSFYVRGPYGKPLKIPRGREIVLVGGGCGIVALHMLAKRFGRTNQITSVLGARDSAYIPYLDEFRKYGAVHTATENGSLGRKGLVTEVLMGEMTVNEGTYFINCGPKSMVEAVLPIEMKVSEREKIYSSLDYMTRCGVGLCGSCSDEQGRRTCVEGPFLNK